MTTNTGDLVRVGNVEIPLATAAEWVRSYTDEARNTTSPRPYAYPAYDRFDRDGNDPHRLSDADLLAPGLLNVPVKIRTFYDLQRLRPILEGALRHPGLERPLDDADAATVAATVAPLYAVLDDPTTKPWNANATTLSKVLHRKRPHALVLHDRWVHACYLGDGGPVPRAEERSWADYMTAITTAIGNDIRTQRSAFEALDAATSTPGELTPVRLLDILAWMSQGETLSEAGSGADPG